MLYESLLREADQLGVRVFEKPMPNTVKGLYADHIIWINKYIDSSAEKSCIIAEEIGHHCTTSGDILDQTFTINRKKEILARTWAYCRLVPISKIIQAYKHGVQNRYEFAEFLGVTEEFICNALKRYQEKYGTHVTVDQYVIRFEPLSILEII